MELRKKEKKIGLVLVSINMLVPTDLVWCGHIFEHWLNFLWRKREENRFGARFYKRVGPYGPTGKRVAHTGQMRAYDGRKKAAVTLMKEGLVTDIPEGLPDDWNIMVSAHIAFVTNDRAKLLALKEQVAALPPSRVEWPRCPADLLDHFGEPFGSWTYGGTAPVVSW